MVQILYALTDKWRVYARAQIDAHKFEAQIALVCARAQIDGVWCVCAQAQIDTHKFEACLCSSTQV